MSQDLLSLLNEIPSVRVYFSNYRIFIEFRMNDPRVLRELYLAFQSFQTGQIPFSRNGASPRTFDFAITNAAFFAGTGIDLERLIRTLELFLYEPDNLQDSLEELKALALEYLRRMDDGATGSGNPARLNEVLDSFYKRNKKTYGLITVDGDETNQWTDLVSNKIGTGVPNFYDDYMWADDETFKEYLSSSSQTNFLKLCQQQLANGKSIKKVEDKLNLSCFIEPTKTSIKRLVTPNKYLIKKFDLKASQTKPSVFKRLCTMDKIKFNLDQLSSTLKQPL